MSKGRKIPAADFARAVALLKAGASLIEAADAIGVSKGGLVFRLRTEGGRQNLGIPAAVTWRDASMQGPDQMAALLLGGASLSMLCRKWGLTANAGRARVQWLRIRGYIPADMMLFNAGHTGDPRHDDAIRAAFESGKCPEQIGGDLLIPADFIRKRLLNIRIVDRPKAPKRVERDGPQVERQPRGWLVTPSHAAALFARSGGQFLDARVAR